MKKSILGNRLPCKICGKEAIIMLTNYRYMVFCPSHQHEYLLKEQHRTKNPQSIKEVIESI